MAFEKQSIDPRGHCGPREHGGKLRVASALISKPGWLLRAVRDVEHDRATERFHLRQGGEVIHEPVVAKE